LPVAILQQSTAVRGSASIRSQSVAGFASSVLVCGYHSTCMARVNGGSSIDSLKVTKSLATYMALFVFELT
jgi:hypothetical protein